MGALAFYALLKLAPLILVIYGFSMSFSVVTVVAIFLTLLLDVFYTTEDLAIKIVGFTWHFTKDGIQSDVTPAAMDVTPYDSNFFWILQFLSVLFFFVATVLSFVQLKLSYGICLIVFTFIEVYSVHNFLRCQQESRMRSEKEARDILLENDVEFEQAESD